MINTVMSSTMTDAYPIYADGLTVKWQRVIRDAVDSCEHEVDKWDIKFTLNEFKVIEDSAFSLRQLN